MAFVSTRPDCKKTKKQAMISLQGMTEFENVICLLCGYIEASSLDQIKMTENWLEFDRKIFTTTNLIF